MGKRRPAEAFRPAEFIAEELDERNWGLETLSARSGLSVESLNRLVHDGHYPVTDEIATGLSAAFGSSVEFWLNLERAYTEWVANAE